jgi:galactokinase/mevalonate kinase-like predicted kinase
MVIIRKRAFARAALAGNPSDGYHGKTVALSVPALRAEVVLYEWDRVDIVLAEDDRAGFSSIHDLARDVALHGYYGGIRLIKATIKRFHDYCCRQQRPLHDRNFSIRYETTIPRQVGLAGSSAIVVATLRCLMEFYDIQIPIEAQPSLVLSVERDELGIGAGLQDRVIQSYEGLVYMDFAVSREHVVDGLACYAYERLDPALLPPIYLAYHSGLSEPTEVFHNDVRGRFDRGETCVVNAMRRAAELAEAARNAIVTRDRDALARAIDENLDVRRGIYRIPAWQIGMADVARGCGASANFAGSGGAVVGTYDDDSMFERLQSALQAIDCRVINLRPEILRQRGPHPPA